MRKSLLSSKLYTITSKPTFPRHFYVVFQQDQGQGQQNRIFLQASLLVVLSLISLVMLVVHVRLRTGYWLRVISPSMHLSLLQTWCKSWVNVHGNINNFVLWHRKWPTMWNVLRFSVQNIGFLQVIWFPLALSNITNKVSLVQVLSVQIRSIKGNPYWTTKNSLKLKELSSINKVSLV